MKNSTQSLVPKVWPFHLILIIVIAYGLFYFGFDHDFCRRRRLCFKNVTGQPHISQDKTEKIANHELRASHTPYMWYTTFFDFFYILVFIFFFSSFSGFIVQHKREWFVFHFDHTVLIQHEKICITKIKEMKKKHTKIRWWKKEKQHQMPVKLQRKQAIILSELSSPERTVGFVNMDTVDKSVACNTFCRISNGQNIFFRFFV